MAIIDSLIYLASSLMGAMNAFLEYFEIVHYMHYNENNPFAIRMNCLLYEQLCQQTLAALNLYYRM